MAETSFGDLLRHHRVAAKLTQEALAERAGLSARGISDLERGARELPRKETLHLLLQALELSPGERATLVAAAHRPPGRAASRSRAQHAVIPMPLTPLIGREAEIAAIAHLLTTSPVRLLSLTGPGGTGKTRLALAVADHMAPAFPDGVIFVALASLADPALVLPAIAAALGVRETSRQSLGQALASHLGEKRLLLILDNLEHLLPAAPLVAGLLERSRTLSVVATSRVRLRLRGEREFPVLPLALPEAESLDEYTDLALAPAVQLFVARAQEVRTDFVLTPDNAPAVAEICRRLDGLPLAIELAAARVKAIPPFTLLNRLEQRLPLLTGGGRDLPTRQQTMRNTIAWSHDLLTPPEQQCLRRLSVFAGGFTLEAAEIVAGGGDHAIDILDRVASLVEHSLLWEEDGPGGEPRYLMLATVREFVLEQLAVAGEEDHAVRAAHAAWCLAFAGREGAAIDPIIQPGAVDVLEAEHPNLRVALAWLEAEGRNKEFLQLAGVLSWFWYVAGHAREGLDWLERALSAGESDQTDAYLLALRGAGILSMALNTPEAEGYAEQTLSLARAAGHREYEADAALCLGILAEDRGDYARGADYFIEARRLAESSSDRLLPIVATYHLGILAYALGDMPEAATLLEEARAAALALGDPLVPSWGLTWLSLVACEQGQPSHAARLLRELLPAASTRELKHHHGMFLESVAVLASLIGADGPTARLFGAADTMPTFGNTVTRAHGMRHNLPEAGAFERAVAAARHRMGDQPYDETWLAGRCLRPQELAAEVNRVLDAAAAWKPPPLDDKASTSLTPRERDVLRCLVEGRSNPEIGAALYISARTAETHVTHILAKLGVATRTEAAAHAIREGLL